MSIAGKSCQEVTFIIMIIEDYPGMKLPQRKQTFSCRNYLLYVYFVISSRQLCQRNNRWLNVSLELGQSLGRLSKSEPT